MRWLSHAPAAISLFLVTCVQPGAADNEFWVADDDLVTNLACDPSKSKYCGMQCDLDLAFECPSHVRKQTDFAIWFHFKAKRLNELSLFTGLGMLSRPISSSPGEWNSHVRG